MLQKPLLGVIQIMDMATGLSKFEEYYGGEYRRFMSIKLGFERLENPEANELLIATLQLLKNYPISYHHFFADIATTFSSKWRDDASNIMSDSEIRQALGASELFLNWAGVYHRVLTNLSTEEIEKVEKTLIQYNPRTVILRPVIESIWEPIAQEDNWQPFSDLLKEIQGGVRSYY
jgi:serine/tyrosine/threonine adenylyltransferase